MIPKYLIIHHSATDDSGTVSWQAIRNFHKNTRGWRDIGYHYGIELINNEYEVLVGRMPDVTGAHTVGRNNDSLGICVVGNYDKDELPFAAFAKLVDLCAALRRVYGIPVHNIKRHSDYANKSCPGIKFPIRELIEALKH